MVLEPPFRSERSLRHRSDPAPEFQLVPRSRFEPAPKIPHAGRDWSRVLCRRHLSRTLSLERDLCVSKRAWQRDIWLTHGNSHSLDQRQLEGALRDALAYFLEKARMAFRHNLGDELVNA